MALHRRQLLATVLAFALVVSCGPAPAPSPSDAATSDPSSTAATAPPTAETVAAAITEAGLARRLAELEAVTNEADGYRSLGSKGYDGAVAYVKAELAAAGWTVSTDVFDANVFTPGVGGFLVVGTRTFDDTAIIPLGFAPGGAAEGPLAALGWDPGTAASGCAPKDYASLPTRAVVVVRTHWECTVRDRSSPRSRPAPPRSSRPTRPRPPTSSR